MPLTKSVGARKGPLAQDLILKYGDDVHPLEALMVPMYEGDVSLSMIGDDFRDPVFRISRVIEIEVFGGGMPHVRDYEEARRDHRSLRARLDADWEKDKRHFKKVLRDHREASRILKRQLEEGYHSYETSAMMLGHVGDKLSSANKQVEEAEYRLKALAERPKVPSSSYLALSANAPNKINLGEFGRIVSRLRQRTIEEHGALPRRTTEDIDMLMRVEVTWN